MKPREMEDIILQMMQAILPESFKIKKRFGFTRSFAGVRQEIGVALVDYNPDYKFSLYVATRLNEAENIFNLFSRADKMYHNQSTTMSVHLDYFTRSKGVPSEYNVSSATDVAKLSPFFAEIFSEDIVPFLDEHKDLRSLDIAMNNVHTSIDHTLNPSRAMHAVIVARLAGNPDFERLVEKHRRDLHVYSAREVGDFERLVVHLRTIEQSA